MTTVTSLCSFTSRCAVFAMEPEGGRDAESLDLKNEKFWEELADNMQSSFELLREMLEKHGIDPNQPPTDEEMAEYDRKQEASDNHPLVKKSEEYMMAVMDWFKDSDSMFEDKADELTTKVRLELPNSSPEDEVLELRDIVDVIQWYHTVIHVKLHRAINGKLEGVSDIITDMPRDCDGSAKIALISIDRSLAAWIKMCEHFPQYEDEFLDFLAKLENLRKTSEYEFPEARAFVRPGFDESLFAKEK